MLFSMTGHGESATQTELLTVAVEVRTLNNRFLKVSLRATEPYHLFESEVERVIKRHIRRGSVQVQLRVERPLQPSDYRLNTTALAGYLAQLRTACTEAGCPELLPALSANLLTLPGVAQESTSRTASLDDDWPTIERTLDAALGNLQAMRQGEGANMVRELHALCQHIADGLEQAQAHLPSVVQLHQVRLLERVRGLLSESGVAVRPDDLIREVAIFAERSDVAEEVTRLTSHLQQFRDILDKGDRDGPGRKLEFVTQEMGREANTIGSKAGDVTISRHAVEIKTTLEKIRELIANVE